MSQDPSVRKLLAPMIEREVELDGAGFRVDRARVLARMAAASEGSEANEVGAPGARRGWVGYAVLAAAGVLALVVGVRLLQRGAADSALLEVAVSDGSATHITRVAAAGELETTARSSAKVSTADGLQIELQNQTRVGLSELGPSSSRVKLLGGAIRCTIPQRSAGHAFQVVTPDVTVVDLGTVFTVSLDGPNHATRVSVEEGEVLVRRAHGETRVRAPTTWSSAAAADSSAALPAPELAPSPPSAEPASSALPAPALKGGHSVVPSTTLAQEAQLLRQGLAAERQGRASDAVSTLTQLITKYPHSPLVPDARAALARVEAGTPR
jgi:FecR protein/Tetratricopeptide repeat